MPEREMERSREREREISPKPAADQRARAAHGTESATLRFVNSPSELGTQRERWMEMGGRELERPRIGSAVI